MKLPKAEIYRGGNSKPRNSRMQTMLRMVGFGDNAGSGFPAILAAWAAEDWPEPELEEDTVLNQVTLKMEIGADSTPKTTPKDTAKSDQDSLMLQILSLIREKPGVSRKEMTRKTGVTLYSIKKEISAMKESHMLEYIGSSKSGGRG